MGSDYASYGRVADFLQAAFPNVTAVLNIFQQQRVRDPTIAKQNRLAEINAAGLINLLNEQIVSHLSNRRLGAKDSPLSRSRFIQSFPRRCNEIENKDYR